MLAEQWKPLMSYERFYLISNRGRIKSLHKANFGNIITTFFRKGLARVLLSKNGRASYHALHRLIAEHFLPKVPNKNHLIFKDGNKANYALENLAWATFRESLNHTKNLKNIKQIATLVRECRPYELNEVCQSLHERFNITKKYTRA